MTLGERPQSAEKSHQVRNAVIVVVTAIVVIAALLIVADLMLIDGYGFASAPIVSIESVACTGSANLVCTAKLLNSGTTTVEANNATITYGGRTTPDSTCGRIRLIPPGTFNFQCNFQTGAGIPGSSFTYSVLLSDGSSRFLNGNFT